MCQEPTAAGLQVLRAIQNDRLPPRLYEWPIFDNAIKTMSESDVAIAGVLQQVHAHSVLLREQASEAEQLSEPENMDLDEEIARAVELQPEGSDSD